MFEKKKVVKIDELKEGDFVRFSYSSGLSIEQFLGNDSEETISNYSEAYRDINMKKYITGEYDEHPDYNLMCEEYFYNQMNDKLMNMKNKNEKIEIVKTEILEVKDKTTFRQTIEQFFKDNEVIDCNAEFV